MGIEAEIYDKENNSILASLKDDIICPICCAVLEDPMLLDCCSGHICSSCLKDVRKTFQSCPLCRKSGYSAIKSRFMMSFCSKIQLVCPVEGCNTAVSYFQFEEHKKRCLELSMQKMSLENHAEKNRALTKELEESRKINKEQKKEIASLKAKINCKDEKIATMEKMYNDQKELTKVIRKNHRELSDKKIELEERFSQVKKENYEYEKEARKTGNQGDAEISARNETLTRELEESKLKNEELKKKIKDQKKQIVSLEAKVRCNDEKTLAIEKMYQKVKIQVDDLSKKKKYTDDCFQVLKKHHREYRDEAERRLDEQVDIIESSNKEIVKMKEYLCAALRKKQVLEEDNEKCKKLLEQKIRENFKFQCKEQA